MPNSQTEEVKDVAKLGWVLASAGYIPFVFLAVTLFVLRHDHSLFPSVFDVFKTWSAVILSFLGGIRWGMGINRSLTDPREIIASTVPAVVGWFALFLPDPLCVLILLLCYCAMGAWDTLTVNLGKAPVWFGKLRTVLTLLVAASHILVFFALF